MAALGARFIAMPGHQGLYGPQGTGLLLCGGDAEPLLYGGSGSASELETMPAFLPDRLEAGTHNVPGIAGLLAGLEYVLRRTPAAVRRHERDLLRQTARGLSEIGGVTVYAPEDPARQTGCLSFTIGDMGSERAAEELGEMGIAVRAGLHCAPMAHRWAGTAPDGTVRVSVSDFSRRSDVAALVSAVRKLTKSKG